MCVKIMIRMTMYVFQVGNLIEEEIEGRRQKERELQKVQIKKEDVELLVSEQNYVYCT